jgi:predicted MFS family arabinose efflux permease
LRTVSEQRASVTAERPEVDRLSRVMAAALLTSICLLPTMLMPYLVGAIALTVTPDSRQLGFVAAAVLGGPIALMAVSMAWVRRFPWRRLVFGGLLGAALGYLLAAGAHNFAALLACIAFGSSALAVAYAPPICALSDTSDPDRNFGYAFFLQIVVCGFVGLAATALQDRFGPRSLFVLMAMVFACSLGLLLWLPEAGVKHETRSLSEQASRVSRAFPIWMGLAGMLLLNAGPSAVWAFFERIGRGEGFAEQSVGNMIALALLIGAPGSLLSAPAARRYGRIRPLALATLLLMVTFGVAIHAPNPSIYLLAGALFQFLLNFSLSFQYGALSEADFSGRLIVLAPTFQGIGGIAAPIVAGMVVRSDSYAVAAGLSGLYEIVGLALIIGLCRQSASAGAALASTTPR